MGSDLAEADASVPRVPLCLNVGITGHRRPVTDHVDSTALRDTISSILDELRNAALRLHAAELDAFDKSVLPPRLICPLADGSDQLTAEIALDLGFELHAVLPFAREIYAADFAEGHPSQAFAGLLSRATRIFELPSTRYEEGSAYSLVGRATVSHSDVLVAIWDGLPARGRGGTAEIVDLAVRCGVPVIHVPMNPSHAPRIIWSADDAHLTRAPLEALVTHPIGAESFDKLLAQHIGPPVDPVERAELAAFYAERERRRRPRLEYSFLLALTGARSWRQMPGRQQPYIESVRAEWKAFLDSATRIASLKLPLDMAQRAYAWSDRLAAHYAHAYRSGHVFNFTIGATAVLLALMGMLAPGAKLVFALAELAAIGAFVLNTRVGIAHNWHRRWLDYRQLAERLRPMRSLTLLGVAQPDLGSATRGRRSWVDWYAAGCWRSAGLPSGRLSADIEKLSAFVVAKEIQPQIEYNRTSAAAISHLDHRLHRLGTLLFTATCLSCAVFIVAYLAAPVWTSNNSAVFVVLSAGLPAIGTAFFGIRVQGDFAGTAARSLVTAGHLAAISSRLEAQGANLSLAADGAEAAARAMLADLAEWRLSHEQRQLELG